MGGDKRPDKDIVFLTKKRHSFGLASEIMKEIFSSFPFFELFLKNVTLQLE